jgi:hypothetical protein
VEPEPEPAAATESEPGPDAESEPAPDPAAESDPDADAEPEAEPDSFELFVPHAPAHAAAHAVATSTQRTIPRSIARAVLAFRRMRRSLAFLMAFAASAHADRKEAPPDTPPFADVVRIELELTAPPDQPTCHPATWTIHVDLVRGRWERSDRACTTTRAGERVATSTHKGDVSAAVKADLAKRYANLDARVPKICSGGKDQILTARLVRRDGTFVTLVDRGCEKRAYLRELASIVSVL